MIFYLNNFFYKKLFLGGILSVLTKVTLSKATTESYSLPWFHFQTRFRKYFCCPVFHLSNFVLQKPKMSFRGRGSHSNWYSMRARGNPDSRYTPYPSRQSFYSQQQQQQLGQFSQETPAQQQFSHAQPEQPQSAQELLQQQQQLYYQVRCGLDAKISVSCVHVG